VLVEFARHHANVEVTARFGCTSRFPAAIAKNTLDIAITSDPSAKNATHLPSEANVWLASSELNIDQIDVVPLAILDRECSWRKFGSDALSAAGKPWRIAYASENFTGVKAAIRSGLAISPLPRLLKDPAMVELCEPHGFPSLPATERAILISERAPQAVAKAMVNAIISATQSVSG